MKPLRYVVPMALALCALTIDAPKVLSQATTPSKARDPGVRGGSIGAGVPIDGLQPAERALFNAGLVEFSDAEDVADGLGPTMNMDSCGGCHAQPAIGGSSPSVNPQVAFTKKQGAWNSQPPFISVDGPVREARFVKNADGTPDGGVHALFTIAGRSDASGCRLAQPDFAGNLARRNVIFRTPTPVFGAGLIEQIPDGAILANAAADAASKIPLGIRGRANLVALGRVSGETNNSGNDGTVARFGWKAQNKSLLIFTGEAYNVEMGVSNELFQSERDATPGCQFATVPNSVTNATAPTPVEMLSAIEKLALFQRFLAPPAPSTDAPGGATSILRGKVLFTMTGCALCHTPSMRTGNAAVAALRYKTANLYSDLLVHDMGPGLADGIPQGGAGPSEFRSAPLWGLGQRIYFLHDGRTADLIEAIQAHASGGARTNDASEANEVVGRFGALAERDKQDLLNFLRSL